MDSTFERAVWDQSETVCATWTACARMRNSAKPGKHGLTVGNIGHTMGGESRIFRHFVSNRCLS